MYFSQKKKRNMAGRGGQKSGWFCMIFSSKKMSPKNPHGIHGRLSSDIRSCWSICTQALESKGSKTASKNQVDGRNPAPVDMVNFSLFTRFYTSQVVVWYFHQKVTSETAPTAQIREIFKIKSRNPMKYSSLLVKV